MTPGLVEREREVAALAALVDAVPSGEGRAVLIEGPAGIGKSALLAETRRRAADGGSLVLAARGSELEREFPFGVVRQLLEGMVAEREHLLTGAAAAAASVFGSPDGEGDVSFAALHGLFWVALNLAAERPLVLAVDDLHWWRGGSRASRSSSRRPSARTSRGPMSLCSTRSPKTRRRSRSGLSR
jgi:ATP/maltotriose-dependent transcriptional regulator MalT